MHLAGCTAGYVSLLDTAEQWFQTPIVQRITQLIPKQSVTVGINSRALREGKSQIVTNPHEDDPDFQKFLATFTKQERQSVTNLHTLEVIPLIARVWLPSWTNPLKSDRTKLSKCCNKMREGAMLKMVIEVP